MLGQKTLISGKYEVESQVGQGGMGVVYKVRHTVLDTILALKVLPVHLTQDPDVVKRFYREARVTARLNHPNIARVLDVHRDDALEFHYFVMEYIEGQTLKQYVQRKGALNLQEVVEITRQVTRALAYAHNFKPSIIHRDIKPTNIMVEDGSRRIVVMDFGIAKELGEGLGDTELTRAGTMLGTLKYCPPEQMRHEPLDGSADVYALGMVMYEAYTGTHLFAGLHENEVIRRVLSPEEYQPLFTRTTPPEFVALITKAIAKRSDKRYREMADLLRDLDRFLVVQDETLPVTDVTPFFTAQDQDDGGPHYVAALEEQIHKLEEERERRLLLQMQAQAQQAREKAAREGAVQFAAELFQQGCAEEESGRTQLRERHYPKAREAYQEAAQLFAQACEKAIAEAIVQRAGQAREEMTAAKLEADRYEARDRARTFYSRGLKFQSQADELWEHRSFGEAYQAYGEARSMFADAHELAYQALLAEEATSVQAQVKVAREQAISEQAEEYASEAFWEAVRNQGRADTALGQEEFTDARELYRTVLRQYGQAQQEARRERQRRHAIAAQAQAREAQEASEAAGSDSKQAAYREAVAAQGRGERHLKGEDYAEAMEAYAQAQVRFGDARTEAERARELEAAARGQAEAARHEAEQAQHAAETIHEDIWAQPELRKHALSAKGQGEKAWAAQRWEEARQEFVQARESFAEAIAFEARQAREEMAAAKAHAEREGAQAKVSTLYERALAREVEAQALWAQKAYGQAILACREARERFDEARTQAGHETLRQDAETERTRLAAAREQAILEQAKQYAKEVYWEAVQSERRADTALAQKKFTEARELYRTALRQYGQAQQEARRERQRQEAVAAQAQAGAAQQTAEAAGADSKQAAYREALAAQGRGEAQIKGQDYTAAAAAYAQAQVRFGEARAEAERARTLEAAAEARRRVEGLRAAAESAGVRGRFAPRLAKAEQVIADGQRQEQAEAFVQAATLYQEAAQALARLLQETELEAAREPAERARRRLAEEKQRGPDLRKWGEDVWAQADRLAGQAEAAWQEQNYGRAVELFDRAVQAYAAAAAEAVATRQAEERQAADGAQKEALSAQKEAEARSAAELFPERFREAVALLAQAERRLSQAEYRTARTALEKGTALFRQLGLEAVAHLQREQAQEARTHAAVLARQAVGLTETRPLRRAHKILAQGDHLLQKGSYAEARERYAQAVFAYQKVLATPPPRPWRWGAFLRYSAYVLAVSSALALYIYWPQPPPTRPETAKPEPPPQRLEPTIAHSTPETETPIKIAEGQRQDFAVTATSPADLALRYAWYLDGKKRAEGERWTYQPDFNEGGTKAGDVKPREVKVVITDAENREATRLWQVEVLDVNRPPQIQDGMPEGDTISMSVGETREFSVRASDPDQGDRLLYTWSLDDKKVAEGERWQFRATAPETPHTVAVEVVDPGGLSDRKTWDIRIKTPAIVSAPPEITHATPELKQGQALTLPEGQDQTFTVMAKSPRPLHYAWFLEGKKKAEGTEWVYQPGFVEGGAKPKEVKVVVTDPENHTAQKTWTVEVRHTNRPPEIVRFSPSLNEGLQIQGGAVEAFSVQATDPDSGDALAYLWSLDGKEVGRGKSWQWHAPATAGEHEVEVKVLDRAGSNAARRWNIVVLAAPLPPTITEADPAEKTLLVEAAQALDFSVTAVPGKNDESGKALRYQWTWDNTSPTTTDQRQFQLAAPVPGKHQLSVVAIDAQGLKSAPRSWAIEVRPREQGVKEPAVKDAGIMEAEVRSWLETYRRAWEQKDVDTLIMLGEVASQNTAKLREVLLGYENFRVALEGVDIRIEGNAATVTFNRVDTIDGKSLPQPGQKIVILEKQTDGRIARRSGR